MSWRAEKGRQQALDHIADEYFGNASVKQRTLRRREKDKKKRRKLRKRLTHRQGLLNNKIPVFVFGNGSWPRRKWGYAPVPRKALVRALARKGIVIILDECVTATDAFAGPRPLDLAQVPHKQTMPRLRGRATRRSSQGRRSQRARHPPSTVQNCSTRGNVPTVSADNVRHGGEPSVAALPTPPTRLPSPPLPPPAHRDHEARVMDRDEISCYAFEIATFCALVYGEWPEYLRTTKRD